jgi:hypothetical protein
MRAEHISCYHSKFKRGNQSIIVGKKGDEWQLHAQAWAAIRRIYALHLLPWNEK